MSLPPAIIAAADIAGLGLSWAEILVIVFVAAVAATIQGSLGVGMGLVASVPLLMIDPAFAPGPILFAGQVVGARHIVAERHHIPGREVRLALLGLLPGLLLGLLVLNSVDGTTLDIIIGASIVAFSVLLLSGFQLDASSRTHAMAGLLATFCSTTAAIPGPPLVMAFSDLDARAFRALVSVVIMAISLFVLAGLVATQRFGSHEAGLLGVMVPGLLVGLGASRWTRARLDGRPIFRTVILVLALVAGVLLVGRSI